MATKYIKNQSARRYNKGSNNDLKPQLRPATNTYVKNQIIPPLFPSNGAKQNKHSVKLDNIWNTTKYDDDDDDNDDNDDDDGDDCDDDDCVDTGFSVFHVTPNDKVGVLPLPRDVSHFANLPVTISISG